MICDRRHSPLDQVVHSPRRRHVGGAVSYSEAFQIHGWMSLPITAIIEYLLRQLIEMKGCGDQPDDQHPGTLTIHHYYLSIGL